MMLSRLESKLFQYQASAFAALGKRTATALGSKIAIAIAIILIAVFSAGLSRQEFETDLYELCTEACMCWAA
jgi:hypothetical protein